MTREEAKNILFDMLGNKIIIEPTKQNQAILTAIKVIEQQSCEDCTVMKKLSKKYYVEDAYGYTDEDIVNKVNEIIDVVNELSSVTPKAEQKWIPCTAMLPKERMNCLITVEVTPYACNSSYEVHTAWFDGRNFIDKTHFRVAKRSVIAWQPLPEAYAESEE